MILLPDGSMYQLGGNILIMFIPCIPAPKGSSRAIVDKKTGEIRYIPGSADSTQDKQKAQTKAMRNAIANLWDAEPDFMPFDGAIGVGAMFVFEAPKHRRQEKYHMTYPDKDKCERMMLDCIGIPKVRKVPDPSVPHLITNDSHVCRGSVSKEWLHAQDKVTEPGILLQIKGLE